MSAEAAARAHVFVEGRVQGVGFRVACRARAGELGVRGWVRNLPDDRVEAAFEGPRGAVEDMVTWCRRGPRGAGVSAVHVEWERPQGEPAAFRIAR